ncbi:MAG: FAD-binding protein [Deltaproteobacteria bacterium]|jgi:electron transfer flavoprotein alpha subunit|nr:FAD-binding protein [Deltaproteobacteria bacterium]
MSGESFAGPAAGLKIAVAVKQVPAGASGAVDPLRGYVLRGGARRLNPHDGPAVEAALRLAEIMEARLAAPWAEASGTDARPEPPAGLRPDSRSDSRPEPRQPVGPDLRPEVEVFSMGPPQADETIREVLSLGPARGRHLCDPAFAGADSLATARALAAALELCGPFRAAVCGQFSADGGTGQVGPALAVSLRWPFVGRVSEILEAGPDRLILRQKWADEETTLRVTLPAVLSVLKDAFVPRLPTVRGRLRPKIVTRLGLSDLPRPDPALYGQLGSPTKILASRRPGAPQRVLTRCSPQEAAAALLAARPDVSRTARPATLFAALSAPDLDVRAEPGQAEPGRTAPKRTPPRQSAPSQAGPARPAPAASSGPVSGRPVAAAGRLLVWLTAEGPGLSRSSRRLARQAAALAAEGGLTPWAAWTADGPPDPARLAGLGLSQALIFRLPADRRRRPDVEAAALAEAIERLKPAVALAPADERGREIAPLVAARFQAGLTADCTSLRFAEGLLVQTRPAFGGELLADIVSPEARPQMATVRTTDRPDDESEAAGAEAREGEPGPGGAPPGPPPEIVELTAPDPPPGVEVLSRRPLTPSDELEKARLVVAGGLGLGGPAGFRKAAALAAALGGTLGGTRAAVERGWLPADRQIGLSGRGAAPELLIALGVSGSAQFMAGVGGAKRVAAVNVDPRAPIFAQAQLGLLTDVDELWPALEELLGPLGAADEA